MPKTKGGKKGGLVYEKVDRLSLLNMTRNQGQDARRPRSPGQTVALKGEESQEGSAGRRWANHKTNPRRYPQNLKTTAEDEKNGRWKKTSGRQNRLCTLRERLTWTAHKVVQKCDASPENGDRRSAGKHRTGATSESPSVSLWIIDKRAGRKGFTPNAPSG